VKRCFFSVEPRVVFTTWQLLPATKKDVLLSHHQSNLIYQFVCHCDCRYVGRTSQRLEERIKQHIPKSITNPPTPHICQSLPRPGKVTSPPQFHHIGHRSTSSWQRPMCLTLQSRQVLAWARAPFHLSALEATFIKSLNSLLCKQKEFVYSLKISETFSTKFEKQINSFHWLIVSTNENSSDLLKPFLLATVSTNENSTFLFINQFGCTSTSFWRCPLNSVRGKALGWISYFTPS